MRQPRPPPREFAVLDQPSSAGRQKTAANAVG